MFARLSLCLFVCLLTATRKTRNSSRDEIANLNFLYDDIMHVLQNTIDSCINSATDRRGYVLERMCLPTLNMWMSFINSAKAVVFCPMFARLSVCLSVCLLAASRKTTDRSFVKTFVGDASLDKKVPIHSIVPLTSLCQCQPTKRTFRTTVDRRWPGIQCCRFTSLEQPTGSCHLGRNSDSIPSQT